MLEPDQSRWETWFAKAEMEGALRVAYTRIGNAEVSTIFLAHAFADETHAALWESQVFGGTLDQQRYRCAGNREQAEAMHAKLVAEVQQLKP